MGGFLIIVGVVIAMIALVYYGSKNDVSKESSTQTPPAQDPLTAQNDRTKEVKWLYEEAEMLFEDNGWDEWDKSVHHASGQLSRIERAYNSSFMKIAQYNPESGYAKVRGDNYNYYIVCGHGCSCPDFRERMLPCKHMYFLAKAMPTLTEPVFDARDSIPTVCRDNMFRGLRFIITGRGQEDAKKYILSHCGSFSDSSFRDVAAVIMADGKETVKVNEAKAKNIMVFPLEKLKTIYKEESLERKD